MQPTLSVCTIVKNEERQLSRMLDSVSGIADEIIITDTGSTDRTVEIAGKYGATVNNFTWNNSFSEARNFTAKKATKSWILSIDADEELINPEEIRKYLFSPSDTLFMLKIINLSNENDPFINTGCHSRSSLFPNNSGYEHFGIIHEHIIRTGNNPYIRKLIPDCEIFHYGYISNQEERKNKCLRNIKLLETEISQREQDSYYYYLHYLLATEFLSLGNLLKAEQFLIKCLEFPDFDEHIIINTVTSLVRVFSINANWKQFERYSRKYLPICQKSPDFCLNYGIIINEIFGKKEESRYFFYKALDFRPEKFPFIIYERASFTWKPLFFLGKYYSDTLNYSKSCEMFEKALAFTNNAWQIQYSLILSYLEQKEYEKAKNMFEIFKHIFPKDEYKDLFDKIKPI